MHHDVLRLAIVNKVSKNLELFFWYLQCLHQGIEKIISMALFVTAELHQTEQQQRLLAGFDLSLQSGTDRTNTGLRIKI